MKPFPFCLSPSKFGGGDGFKSNLGRVAGATGSEDCGMGVGCAGVIAVSSRSIAFKASRTWLFLAS
jgi:hypothetical protein